MLYSNSKRVDAERMSSEIISLKDRVLGYQESIKSLQSSLKSVENAKNRQEKACLASLTEKDAIIKALKSQLAHISALAERNGTNTGIPTSATPINKKKIIPNTRRGSGKPRGGQPGHERHTLSGFDEDEITDRQEHELNLSDETCDSCQGTLSDTGKTEYKDEFDVKVMVVKRRHHYHIYECTDCGARVRLQIGRNLKEPNQYGSNLQAAALSLMATGNVAINKVCMLIHGMTGGEIAPSEGFICKLYRRASMALTEFMAGLRCLMLQRTILYWDDTVIMIKNSRSCMRFYGDESISYYTAHDRKDLNSLLEDNILPVLTKETTVMHDHNKVNYNERFSFENIECNQHLERDLQKVADDNQDHTWSKKMKGLISLTIKERNDAVAQGRKEFPEEYIQNFRKKMRQLIKKGHKERTVSTNPTTVPSENTLLIRIEKFFDNYFRWVADFTLPTTDNLSERGLRGIKSHMKISGQFESEKTASYYAIVKTYVETCRKNRINEMEALSRLCAGNPVTVGEIFA